MFEISRQARRRVRIAASLPTHTPPAIDAISTVLAALPDPAELTARDRAGVIHAVAVARNQLDAYLTDLAGAADTQQDSRVLHAGTTGTLIAAATTADPATGSAIVSRARALRDLPAIAGAYRAGRISPAHVNVITAHARRIDGFTRFEADIATIAEIVEPSEIRRLLNLLADQCDPDALDRDATTNHAKREVSLSQLPSGMWRLDGYLDPVTGQRLADGLAALMDRRTPDDQRGPKQRRADAFTDLITAGLANTHPCGVSQVSLLVDADTLTTRLEDGTPIGQLLAELIGCDPDLNIILGHPTPAGFAPLALGRLKRRASAAQWRALIARDRGCIRCGKTPRHCQAHHIIGWAAGGKTDLHNLVLLCSRCHHDLHFGHYTITTHHTIPTIHPTHHRGPPH